MTLSDIQPDVQVRTRTHGGQERRDLRGGSDPSSARAPAISNDPDVQQGHTPGAELEIFDHPASISTASEGRSAHLAEAGLSLAENYLAATPPATVRQAWAGINGDSGEDRGRGLTVLWLWLCGLLRALLITTLYALALSVSTRRRTGGVMIVCGLLTVTFFVCRALLP